jgi:hypothetical protein
MGIGLLQPMHLLLIALTTLLIVAVCAAVIIGTGIFLIRYALRQQQPASNLRRERE